MKPGNRAIQITMLVIFLGIAAYFGIYIYRSINAATELATVFENTAEDRIEVDGWLVRDEHVIDDATGDLMEILVQEGEKVPKGGVVARIYSSEEAADRQKEIATLEEELERLQDLTSGAQSEDAVEMDNEIVSLIQSIHRNLANGSFSSLNDDAEDMKDDIFRRGYLYNDSTDLASDISEIANEIATLESETSTDTIEVTGEVSGTFSSYVDGYENLLTLDKLEDLTPSALAEWTGLTPSTEASQYIGKLISGHGWYFVTTMSVEDADRLSDTVTVRFTGDFSTPVTMDVESISKEEDGEVVVEMISYDSLSDTSQLRYEAADVVYSSTTGLEVPLSAVRLNTTTNDDGTTTTEEGVYVVVGTRAEWKPIKVLYTGDDFCLVESLNEGEADALRSGDTVIAKGKNIYSGKVITQ